MKRKLAVLTVAGALCFGLNAQLALAGESDDLVNQSITYFCSKNEVNTQQSVAIGTSTKVNLNSGPFYQIVSQSDYQATLDLVADELSRMGVDPDCAEYLMTRSRLQGYEQGNVMARVYFDFDKYNLTEESKYILNVVSNVIKTNPSELILEGHTDNIGDKDYNFSLGLKRSDAVQKYLLDRGVNGQELQLVSKGEGEPIADNRTEDGRAKNRRVDIVDELPVE